MNTDRTLNENIADNGGLQVAYRAFQYAKSNERFQIKLNDIVLTDEQLFFLAFGEVRECIEYIIAFVFL